MKREMMFEFKPLTDVVAKPLMEKAGSFDAFTFEIFLIINTISIGLKVNWGVFFFKFKECVVN